MPTGPSRRGTAIVAIQLDRRIAAQIAATAGTPWQRLALPGKPRAFRSGAQVPGTRFESCQEVPVRARNCQVGGTPDWIRTSGLQLRRLEGHVQKCLYSIDLCGSRRAFALLFALSVWISGRDLLAPRNV